MLSEISVLLPAFVIGLLMMIIHVPLGQEVLRRGIIFIDLSLAQIAAMGAIFAGMLELNLFATQACALSCALLGGLFFKAMEKHFPEIAEAVIGCVFVLSATLVILALAGNPHGAEHINDILSGQLLFATWGSVAFAGTIFTVSATLVYWKPDIFMRKYFYLVLAAVITTSVQVCGVYLVFASLIFPAVATAYMEDGRKRRIIEYAGEASGLAAGLAVSFFFDLPAGPAAVWGISMMIPVCLAAEKRAKNSSPVNHA
ncbi:MAG: metal ABC transporter permease [Elusimicrobiales bacterium]|nr:metal ABC transporter permease [Elusimicrobiales bacterium]